MLVSSPLNMQLLRAGPAAHEHIVHAEREPPQSVPVSSPLSVQLLHARQAVHEPPKSLVASSAF